jgi:hypothetical protein
MELDLNVVEERFDCRRQGGVNEHVLCTIHMRNITSIDL